MVKSNTVKELIHLKVATALDHVLKDYGFRYHKTNHQFVKMLGEFQQIITIHQEDEPIDYHEETEDLFLNFFLRAEIKVPNYSQWYQEHVKNHLDSLYVRSLPNTQVKLTFDDFDFEDFHEATAQQSFKQAVNMGLNQTSTPNHSIEIDELLSEELPKLVQDLDEKSDFQRLFETRTFANSLKHYLLLYYSNTDTELVKEYFIATHQQELAIIEEKLKISEQEASLYISALDESVQLAQHLFNLELENPYSNTLKIVDPQHEVIHFTPNSTYQEALRLNISALNVESHQVDQAGNVLLVTDHREGWKTIHVIAPNGAIILEQTIQPQKGFGPFGFVKTGVIEATQEFYVNHYVIRNCSELIELALPKIKKNQQANIYNFAYDSVHEKYIILYENRLLTYHNDGALEKEVILADKHYKNYEAQLVVEKQWIITQKKDKEVFILNFDGEIVYQFAHLKSNFHYCLSPNHSALISHFYANKSQFIELESGKISPLWAHPTHLKNYTEFMYNDIHHNFGMHIVQFSPDNQYIVGGAEHGKYVAWTLPKLERKELIPPLDRLSSDTHQAEIFQIGKETFLKNRANNITQISFLENGDYFLTEIERGQRLLVWNRNFEFVKDFQFHAMIHFHSKTYCSKISQHELVIYQLKS